MSKHTPGPWEACALFSASENHHGFFIGEPNGYRIATVIPMDCDGIEGLANARLIAAAPEFLEALRTFANVGEYRELREAMAMCLRPHERDGFLAAFEQAKAAIAKATGSDQ